MKTFLTSTVRVLSAFACAWLSIAVAFGSAASPRERIRFDAGWRFHLGNDWGTALNLAKAGSSAGPAVLSFGDATWREVDLPHDWAIELPFDKTADGSHGFKALGQAFPQNHVGWYRRVFDLPATDAGRRLSLEFDGIYRDATVFVNGWAMTHHESGYSGFRVDITDVANYGGKNVVAVRVDATQAEGWFYEGAGIYRHVWLVKTAPVAIAPDGIFVYSDLSTASKDPSATLHFRAEVANKEKSDSPVSVRWEVSSPGGKVVASAMADGSISAGGTGILSRTAEVQAPLLWTPETPSLYVLHTKLFDSKNTVIDEVDTPFGIRSFGFDADKGFLLNGLPYVLKGTCNHQDHAGVGAAIPDAVQVYRVKKLKELGSNAYRTSHNPPTPELLDACDRLGLIVMDENRVLGSDPQHLELLSDLVRRDRNHASVGIWSLGNEEWEVGETASGARVAAVMQRLIQEQDPTRPVTYNAPVGNSGDGVNSVIEVRGWSYHIGESTMDAYHAAHPKQPNVGSEQGSSVGTRGIYSADKERGYVSAYDDNAQAWSNTAEQWFTFFDHRPWLSGGFVWTGFDYRGEPTPYGWPCINSHFGIFDTCGFPKDNFYYYQSWWTNTPVLHILPHWNWSGREGQAIDVRVFSNCDEVELFLNGRSLGKKKMVRASHLRWSVPYEPGALSAKGFRAGQIIAETKVETTGPAVSVNLVADRTTLAADGRDVAVVTVALKDSHGRVVPTADNHVTFSLEGAGKIVGVGNGDPSCHEPDVYIAEPKMQIRPISTWKWKQISDPWARPMPEAAVSFDDSNWAAYDVNASNGPLKSGVAGVFRTKVNVSAEDLQDRKIDLWLGKIRGNGAIFVNEKLIGRGFGPWNSTVLDVGNAFHEGENTIAVVVNAEQDDAGLIEGASLRLPEKSTTPQWSRSAFNGYAQVIVASRTLGGAIRLTAQADGLKPSTIELHSAAAK